MTKEDSVLDYREPEWVAKKLGLDKNTVYKYLQEGHLPGVQLGRKWLISERLLAAHLERETHKQVAARKGALPQTPRLKRSLQLATEYACSRGQDYTGTEHLLLGMVQEGQNLAVVILKNLRVDLAKLRDLFESQVPAAPIPAKEAPLTDRAKHALRLAQEQGIAFGHEYVGCEGLLLGLLLEPTGLAHQILAGEGMTYDRAREEMLRLVKARD